MTFNKSAAKAALLYTLVSLTLGVLVLLAHAAYTEHKHEQYRMQGTVKVRFIDINGKSTQLAPREDGPAYPGGTRIYQFSKMALSPVQSVPFSNIQQLTKNADGTFSGVISNQNVIVEILTVSKGNN